MAAALAHPDIASEASDEAPAAPGSSPRRIPHSLRDRAYAFHLEGMRSPTIAAQLGVPERTVRSWITTINRKLAEERAAEREERLIRAVESCYAVSAAAWQAYE